MTRPLAPPLSISVTELLQILAGSGLRLESGHAQLRLPMTNPTLFDSLAPPTGQRSGILLGIGLHPADPSAADTVRDAAARGFGAVVVKSHSAPLATLVATAHAAGIALLVADDDIEWRQLDSLIGSALTTATEASSPLSTLAVGDLFALANAIAARVGGATAIEDLQERVLAYSTLPGQPIDEDRREGILGRQVPDLPENAGQYASLFRSPGACRVPGIPPALDRLAVAVRAGSRTLGSIWVVDAHGDFDEDAERALEQAAEIAALHLLRARSSADLARQQRAELLRRLVEGGEDAPLALERLGLDAAGPFTIVAFQPTFSLSEDEARLERLVDLIAMQCEAHQHGTECVVIGTTVYAVFTGAAAVDCDRLLRTGRVLVSRAATALRIPLRVAVGGIATRIGTIGRSRRDADLVLLLPTKNQAAVASARDVRSKLTLVELAHVFRDSPSLLSDHALRVVECDANTGTEYAATLCTYLDCVRDSAATSARLSIHQNTLRYRLARAKELFDIDLNDPDDTLALWLSLRILEFDGMAQSARPTVAPPAAPKTAADSGAVLHHAVEKRFRA